MDNIRKKLKDIEDILEYDDINSYKDELKKIALDIKEIIDTLEEKNDTIKRYCVFIGDVLY